MVGLFGKNSGCDGWDLAIFINDANRGSRKFLEEGSRIVRKTGGGCEGISHFCFGHDDRSGPAGGEPKSCLKIDKVRVGFPAGCNILEEVS